MENRNVFFVAPAGSGKTYCANYLIKKYNYVSAKMAYPVYMIAEKYFGMKNKDRQLLQIIGSEVGRDLLDDNLWVTRFFEDIRIVEETARRLNKKINFVADDIRFANEYRLLSEMGWIGIYLEVPQEIRISRLQGRDGDAQLGTLNHKSETELDSFKNQLIKMDASGTLEQTYQNLEEVLEYIRQEKI